MQGYNVHSEADRNQPSITYDIRIKAKTAKTKTKPLSRIILEISPV